MKYQALCKWITENSLIKQHLQKGNMQHDIKWNISKYDTSGM